jgi:TolB-like protein
MVTARQVVVSIALTITPLGLAAQDAVSIGGFETHGSVGLDRADYDALGRALSALLSARLGERAATRVVAIAPVDAGRPGRVDLAAARDAAARAGAKLLVVGSLLDQYGDIQIEARLIDASTGKPLAVVRGDPAYVKREQLALAVTALADELTRQPGVGGQPSAAGSGIPLEALLEFGRGLAAEAGGDGAGAAAAYRRAVAASPGFTEAQAALRRVGG